MAPCPDYKAPNVVLQVPNQAAVGRSTPVVLHLTGADDRDLYTGFEHASVTAADPAHPIAHPVEGDAITQSGADTVVANVTFSPGDGPAVVNARWQEQLDDGYGNWCSRSAPPVLITPVAGRLPRVKLTRSRDYGLGVDIIDSLAKQGCAVAAADPVTVEVSSGTQRAKLVVTDPCDYVRANGHGAVRSSGATDGPRFAIDAADGVVVSGRGTKDAVRTVSYRVLLGSTVLTKGHFWIRVNRSPDVDIYEGTDDFVNICINHDHTVRSRHHRLYCTLWGSVERDYFFTTRPKTPHH